MSILSIENPYKELIEFKNKIHNICIEGDYDKLPTLFENDKDEFDELYDKFREESWNNIEKFEETRNFNLIKHTMDIIEIMYFTYIEFRDLCIDTKPKILQKSKRNYICFIWICGKIRTLMLSIIYMNHDLKEIQKINNNDPFDIDDIITVY